MEMSCAIERFLTCLFSTGLVYEDSEFPINRQDDKIDFGNKQAVM